MVEGKKEKYFMTHENDMKFQFVSISKVYWNIVIPICLYIVHGQFPYLCYDRDSLKYLLSSLLQKKFY